MPTYEYQCSKCGHKFERFQSITENPVKKCPKCKGKVKRIIGGEVNFIFKGSGFYITDYKKKNVSETKQNSGKNGQTCKAEGKSNSSNKTDSVDKKK